MNATTVDQTVRSVPGLQEGGLKVARAIHKAVLGGGKQTRAVADVVHGTWLGHPLHPALTDIPIGAWSLATLFDAVAAVSGSRDAEQLADMLIAAGAAAAVPTAIAGLADYSTVPQPAAALSTLHGLLNSSALALYLLALRARKNGDRRRGIMLSMLAYGLVVASSFLGGDLVYRQRVGVNHSEPATGPQEWTAVLDAAILREYKPQRVEVAGTGVLLYRDADAVYAIGAVCSHAAGPLEQGTFYDHCVQCPWHDSVFDLRDGHVVHGPATHAQPRFAARIHDGWVEVRLRRAEASA